jgi:hypothetical protein
VIIWVPAESGAENELHAFRLGEAPVQLSELSTLCGMRSNMDTVKSLIIPIGTRCEICEHKSAAKHAP